MGSLFKKNMAQPAVTLFNTASRTKEVFSMENRKVVRMYNCGPTVYGIQHIGNMSAFVFADILRKTLESAGYTVKQVINITDVGHLQSDADEGNDKMTLGLQKEGLSLTLENMKVLAEKYTSIFLDDLASLGLPTDSITFPRASEYIPSQIALLETLVQKGYAYQTSDGMYFDTAKFPRYGCLSHAHHSEDHARIDANLEKHDARDFALWKFNTELGWDTPWGKGFPGWHIECSAMARSTLGEQLDIHTGGVEHIDIHHNNEIAQSESAFGKAPFARFWMHRAHIQIDSTKISKSLGNVVYLSELVEKGFHPLSLRYFFLQSHYRSHSNFTFEALSASQTALVQLVHHYTSVISEIDQPVAPGFKHLFLNSLYDDLNSPAALAALWTYLSSDITPAEKKAALTYTSTVLGLKLTEPDEKMNTLVSNTFRKAVTLTDVAFEVRALVDERSAARTAKDFARSDALRSQLLTLGYEIKDTRDSFELFKVKLD
jgi:cysteinyl-tRNA synthetase